MFENADLHGVNWRKRYSDAFVEEDFGLQLGLGN